MLRISSAAFLLFTVGMLLAFMRPEAEGCGIARRSDRPEDYVRIAEESAIIVWDPVKKVEHFIRRAAFDTKSPDFGFLVPTPSMPTLEKVEEGIFRETDRWILPKTVEETKFKFDAIMCSFGCGSMKSRMAGEAGVRVLGEQKVGGYETAILEGDSTEAVSDWLKKNGYSNDPELQSWLFPYIANKWKITAFKISQDAQTGQLATTKPVRMSFATDKPFFPYREPEVKNDKQNHAPRVLRVFFVGDTRMEGKLGEARWNARVQWSDELTEEQRAKLAKETGVAAEEIAEKAWMTAFEDPASPRPGKEEVYFEPSPDRTPIRPKITHYNQIWIPAELILLAIVGCVLVTAFIVQRFGKKSSPSA